MGNKCANASYRKITEVENPQQEKLYLQLRPIFDMTHSNNINNKYRIIQKILPQNVGRGIKKTQAFISLIKEEQLIQRRIEFWETRDKGQPECWALLKRICQDDIEGDSEKTFELLADQGLKIVEGSIQICFEQRNVYEIPIFCINNPLKFEAEPLSVKFQEQQINFTMRCKQQNDIKFQVMNTMTGEQLKQEILKQISGKSIRLFIKGKEIDDIIQLGNYQINDQIVQAFIL
ncbi:Ubiquitin domain-containing protein 2 [Paramecium bursaria]